MAITFPKQQMAVYQPDDAWLGMVTQYLPEGASQTFVDGAPVIFSSGYIIIHATSDPITEDIAGFAQEAGHNTTAGAKQVGVVPCIPGIHLHANFLGAAAADNVLAQTDLGITRDLDYSATLLGAASPGYYIEDAAANATVKIVSFKSDYTPSVGTNQVQAAAGDTNARLRAAVLVDKCAWTE